MNSQLILPLSTLRCKNERAQHFGYESEVAHLSEIVSVSSAVFDAVRYKSVRHPTSSDSESLK